MQLLNKTQLQCVSGGSIGLDDMINVWAGYDNWNYSTVVSVNAAMGAMGGFLWGLKVGSPAAGLILGVPIMGTIAYGYAALEYKIGAYIDATQKAKWAEFHAAQQQV